jgi:endonuclease III
MPSYVEVTEEELKQLKDQRNLELLRTAADVDSWTSKPEATSRVETEELDSFVVNFPSVLPDPNLVVRGKTVPLRLRISTKPKLTKPLGPRRSIRTTNEKERNKKEIAYVKERSDKEVANRNENDDLDLSNEKENKDNTHLAITESKDNLPKAPKAKRPKKKQAVTSKSSKKLKVATVVEKQVNNQPSAALPKGCYDSWCTFGEGGGYSLSIPQWKGVRDWVSTKRNDADFVADNVAFHRLVVSMKQELNLESARDKWVEALPSPESSNFEICVLFLMVCTPLVPDTKIVELFGPIFQENDVDIDWILEKGKVAIAEILRPLGRQNDSAKYVVEVATALEKLKRFPRDYRDLVKLPGVGPKVALVTIQESFGLVQGVPCDVHMCRIFRHLGWIPGANLNNSVSIASILESKKEKEMFDYELSRAAIEGWFPRHLWGEMNQTWAGLGQLLNDATSKRSIALYVDSKVADLNSAWRVADKLKLAAIMGAYTT